MVLLTLFIQCHTFVLLRFSIISNFYVYTAQVCENVYDEMNTYANKTFAIEKFIPFRLCFGFRWLSVDIGTCFSSVKTFSSTQYSCTDSMKIQFESMNDREAIA